MATASDVLRVARGELGYSRWNDPQAGTKYGRWYAALVGSSYYGESGVPYCAMFTSWVFDQTKAKCVGLPGAYCPYIVNAGRKAGKTVAAKSAMPGDVVLFDWDGDGVSDHVGIVEENTGSYLQCIEGNTDNGQVKRRTRAYGTVICVIRPDYDGATTVSPATPSAGGKLDVDGDIGYLSVTEWQTQMGTPVDGVLSGQVTSAKQWLPALSSIEWASGGSTLLKAVQKKVGVPNPTGAISRGTVCMIQGYLVLNGYDIGSDQAGKLDVGTAKAIQRSLNDGKIWQ